jgi:hypothetical protein
MDLIKIFNNIYICNYNCNKLDDEFKGIPIQNVINVNGYKANTKDYNTLNVKFPNIDYNLTNDFLITTIKRGESVVICGENYVVGFLIVVAFCLKVMKMPFTYSVYYVQRKTNVDVRKIGKDEMFGLFKYGKS